MVASTEQRPRVIAGDSLLNKFVEMSLQDQINSFRPTWTNPHVQSLLGAAMPQAPIRYKRHLLTLQDNGQVAIDWAVSTSSVPEEENVKEDTPILLLLHGLTGGSHAMRNICARAMSHGYRPVALNRRGHGNVDITTPRLQSFSDVSDLQQAVKHIQACYPKAPIYAIAFSAGTALLSAYLHETGDTTPIRAGVLVSPGYDAQEIFQGNLNPTWNRLLALGRKSILFKHRKQLRTAGIRVRDVFRLKTIGEIEEQVYAKLNGYSDMESYWKENNPALKGFSFARPLMIINAQDDPICSGVSAPYEKLLKSSNIFLVETPSGGHCGFLEGRFRLKPWSHKLAFDYLDCVQAFGEIAPGSQPHEML